MPLNEDTDTLISVNCGMWCSGPPTLGVVLISSPLIENTSELPLHIRRMS